MEKHEVVIVGAGPGGLKAAQTLAENGKDVLVLERRTEKEIGDKLFTCTTPKRKVNFFPDSIKQKSFKSETVHFGKNILTTKFEITTFDFYEFMQYQLNEAKNAGADIKSDCPVTEVDVKTKKVKTKSENLIEYDYLIGADGCNSIVAKSLGFRQKIGAIAREYLVENCKENEVHAFLNFQRLGMGYSWIAPYGKGLASIGFGGLIDYSVINKEEMFKEFFKNETGIDLTNVKSRSDVVNTNYRGFKFGGTFLIGEAAGFNSMVWGEGIYPSWRTGEIAANTILDPKYNYKKPVRNLSLMSRIAKPVFPVLRMFEPPGPVNAFGKLLDLASIFGNITFLQNLVWKVITVSWEQDIDGKA